MATTASLCESCAAEFGAALASLGWSQSGGWSGAIGMLAAGLVFQYLAIEEHRRRLAQVQTELALLDASCTK